MGNNPALADFDIALRYGQERERSLRWYLEQADIHTLEAKSQPWSKTHVFIEHEGYGKPRGIAITKADAWAIEVHEGWWVLIPTDDMRKLHQSALQRFRERAGGDRDLSRGAIVPKTWLVAIR